MIDILSPYTTSKDISFYRDTSASENLGFGCIFNSRWFRVTGILHFGKSEVNHKYIRNIKRNEGTLKIRDTLRNKSQIDSEIKIQNRIRDASEMNHK